MAIDKKRVGTQPEALRTFEAAARSGGVKPKSQGLTARPETEALPDSNDRKAQNATKVLRAGVEHDPKTAGETVRKNPDPRLPK